ncbi:uncharacterized protein RJT20DRAFT_21701 [Scheffersomyces xylosifermentans]|uniref:uncharacterized protein n=1 Tax=Scheffersomyces xylosifermentans TaxID=1304137 RepID=UPI00315D5005
MAKPKAKVKKSQHSYYDNEENGTIRSWLIKFGVPLLFCLGAYAFFGGYLYSSKKPAPKLSFGIRNSPISSLLDDVDFNPLEVPYYSVFGKEIDTDTSKCDEIREYDNSSISVSYPMNLNHEGTLKDVRDIAKKLLEEGTYPVVSECFLDEEYETEEYILKNRWFQFSGSAVWMDAEEVYFYVSRVVYARKGDRVNPSISVLYAQVFDRDWKEIKDYKFASADMVFPTILPIEIDIHMVNRMQAGPEDPRVVLRKFYNEKKKKMEAEPYIIFNESLVKTNWRRAMFSYRPFSTPNLTTELAIEGKIRRLQEKNWSPFFEYNDYQHIYFLYNFEPLRILKCNMDSGLCNKTFGPDYMSLDVLNQVGNLRGGTSLVRIPQHLLPEGMKTRKYWLGFGRSRSENFRRHLYRPHAYVLSKDVGAENKYSIDYISSFIDFNFEPATWFGVIRHDETMSVLIPNSIAYWDFASVTQEDGSTVQEDIMGITISESDRTNKIVYMKGWLKHILQVLNKKDVNLGTHYAISSKILADESHFLCKCSTSLVDEYCDRYKDVGGLRFYDI